MMLWIHVRDISCISSDVYSALCDM